MSPGSRHQKSDCRLCRGVRFKEFGDLFTRRQLLQLQHINMCWIVTRQTSQRAARPRSGRPARNNIYLEDESVCTSHKVLRDDLNWVRHPSRVDFKLCTLLYKALHGIAPMYLSEFTTTDVSDVIHCDQLLLINYSCPDTSAARAQKVLLRCRSCSLEQFTKRYKKQPVT